MTNDTTDTTTDTNTAADTTTAADTLAPRVLAPCDLDLRRVDPRVTVDYDPEGTPLTKADFAALAETGQMTHRVALAVRRSVVDQPGAPEWLYDTPMYFVLSGSLAYGIHTDTSDVDVLGFYVPPPVVRSSLFPAHEQSTFKIPATADFPGIEGTVYRLDKLVKLCAENNPTVMEVLWSPGGLTDTPPDVRAINNILEVKATLSKQLVILRKACLSQRVRSACAGYAVQQFRKIQSHRNWMLGEAPERPSRAAFGLPERPEHWVQAVEAAVQRERGLWSLDLSAFERPERIEVEERLAEIVRRYEAVGVSRDLAIHEHLALGPDVTARLLAENTYSAAVKAYDSYLQWQKNRNPVRAELERRYGYDTKHAGHLLRLYRLGVEALTHGEMRYNRRGIDADEIRGVRQGSWSWDAVAAFGATVDDGFAAASANTVLPTKPDRRAIDAIYLSMLEALDTLSGS